MGWLFNANYSQLQITALGANFAEGGKLEYLEKNPWSQIKIDKSQPTCGARESITGCGGGAGPGS